MLAYRGLIQADGDEHYKLKFRHQSHAIGVLNEAAPIHIFIVVDILLKIIDARMLN